MKTLHIIPHSHWDREWYMSFEQHRIKLVELIDTLIETMEKNPDYKYYHMDGQYIVIEDYLEIRPQMKERLCKLIRDDRIQIGPWYVLQDEFLTSGEANVRNMLYGIKLCKSIGADPVMCGYFPDAFGNISQAPQILKGFGIEYAAFGRGINDVGTNNSLVKQNGIVNSELIWKSPDGSQVIGIMFANWYHNAMQLPSEKKQLKERMEEIVKRTDKFAKTPHLLGLNGCDHQPVQVNLPEVIKKSQNLVEGIEIVHSNFKDYCDNVGNYKDKFSVFEGEIAGQFTNGLNNLVNTASSRIPLKQLNHKAQNMLERISEPINSLAFVCGHKYPSDFMLYAWKKLMENHPHDSICGCHMDDINDEMITRFKKSIAVSEQLKQDALTYFANNINTLNGEEKNIFVWNLEPFGAIVKTKVNVDFELEENVKDFYIVNFKNEVVPAQITHIGKTFTYTLPKDEFRKVKYVNRYEVEFCTEIEKGLSYEMLRVVCDNKTSYDNFTYSDSKAENEFILMEINTDGSLKVTDKKAKNTFNNLNIYENAGDKGELYNFRNVESDVALTTYNKNATWSIFESSPYSVTYEIVHSLEIPEGLEDNHRTCCTIEHSIKTYATITKGIARIDIRTQFENKSENHRLRALFPNDIQTKTDLAEGQFDVVERSIDTWENWVNPSNNQRAQAFFGLCDENKGLLIATKGLHEYEVTRDGSNTLGLTLLRCVGEVGDWGIFPAPEGQCKGDHVFEYSIVPFVASEKAKAYRIAYNFSNNPTVSICTGKHDGILPDAQSFLDITGDFINMSALKKSEDRESVIFRLHNTDTQPQQVRIRCNSLFKNAYLVNLNEERQKQIEITNGEIMHEVNRKKIVSIELEF